MNGFSIGEEDSHGPTDLQQICCLVDDGVRCPRPIGNASYSKRIQQIVTQKRLKLHLDNFARHIYICEYHKCLIQSVRNKRRRKDSEDDSNENDESPDVDLFQLQVNTLRRYKKYFKVTSRPGLNKAQLAETLLKHFKTIPVVEKDVLSFFFYTVKSNTNKLDQKNGNTGENT
ncbi:hypothetical protein M8J76_011827 [Diaphorina citri]|nr:hypothetical protein M8J75_002475 [Diaphorina citri]KAI5733424.1 hypothetical protein M8J76_011827 [Diaphorina citri]KAI5738023.1 hypothetical protein M8J77_001927 [Diaphorina citri]